MHSPPPSSSDLFLFSPPRETTNGPQEEVESLLATASKVKVLSNNLAFLINKNKTNFLTVFGRQVQLLKSRSQAFEDAHITVYDKVLLTLTKNGNDLECPAAVAWYCAEYLGINTDGDISHNAHLIEQVLELPIALTQGLTYIFSAIVQRTKTVQALTPVTLRKTSDADGQAATTTPTSLNIPSKDQAKGSSKTDPKLAQLWSVYSKAHAEYLTIAANKDSKTLEAAKFLRDTAENGIHYLQKKSPRDPALVELNNTLTTAKKAVLNLNGGKKRKFDKFIADTLVPHTIEHNRVNAGRRKRNRGPFGTALGEEKEKRKHRGRGPSGIPYGYSRPVDSYCPI